MKIAIINGPNLNLLGKREPEIYGNQSFEQYLNELRLLFPLTDFEYFQSNIEGELISKIQQLGFSVDGIILNAAAYTHTSVGIGDAVAAIKAPVIEVHISNVFAREKFRQESFIAAHARGVIAGLGLKGYEMAARALGAK